MKDKLITLMVACVLGCVSCSTYQTKQVEVRPGSEIPTYHNGSIEVLDVTPEGVVIPERKENLTLSKSESGRHIGNREWLKVVEIDDGADRGRVEVRAEKDVGLLRALAF